MKTPIGPSRGEIVRRLSKAVADGKGITIRLDGDSGKLTIKVGTELVAKYTDVYEAVAILLPEYMKEVA